MTLDGLNSDMLRLINADLYGAVMYKEMSKGSDEVYLNYAAYHLSQAAEKTIKLFIIMNGELPPKTHPIKELLSFVRNKGIWTDNLIEMENMSNDLDEWASKTRYIISHFASLQSINKVQTVVEDFLSILKKIENVENTPETELKKSNAFKKK